MIALIVILVIAAVLVIWLISSYNGFITLRNKTEEAYSAMDVSLKKRYDLIPNYVETVKGYAKHEAGTLEKVVSARNMAMGASDPEERLANENVLTGALIFICGRGSLSGFESKPEFYTASGSASEDRRRDRRFQKILQRSCQQVQYQGRDVPWKYCGRYF